MCLLLVYLLLHHAKDVRRAAQAAVAPLTGRPALLGPLLAALRHWMANQASVQVLVVSGFSAKGRATGARPCCMQRTAAVSRLGSVPHTVPVRCGVVRSLRRQCPAAVAGA